MSIRTRILAAIFALVGLGFYAQVGWILDDLRPRYLGTMEESMIDAATILASLLSGREGAPDAEPLRTAFAEAKERRFVAQVYELTKTRLAMRVTVTDDKGTVVFDSDGQDAGKDYSRWNDVIRTLRGEYGARTTLLDPGDPQSAILHVGAPIVRGGRTVGVLTVSKSVESVGQFLQTAKHKIILAGLVAGLSAALFGAFVTAWITRPIERLSAWAQDVRAGRRAALPVLGRSEIGRLGASFEAMRDALEGKQYVEDYVQTLTHEMKSPLSSIRGAAELLEDEMPPPQRTQFLATIRSEAERIQNLVERLLHLASLERRKELHEVAEFGLAALVEETAAGMAPLLAAKRIGLEREVDATASVRGERFLIRQALANLVQNAIDFAPAGGRIRVSARRDGAWIELAVQDDGPGVPEYALARAFERFYSLPRPDTGRKSTGLGLTFVREAAQLHGGSAVLENAAEGGARAILRLPVDGPAGAVRSS